MEHPEKVLGVTFISHDQTSEVLQPGKKPLDFPAPLVSLQATFILGRVLSIPTMWGDELQPVTICNRHDLCSLAAFRLSDLMSPFLAGAKLASINASRTSMPPLALRFKARAVMIFVITTRANPLLKAPVSGL